MNSLKKIILYLGMLLYSLQGPYLYPLFFVLSIPLLLVALNFKFSINTFFVKLVLVLLCFFLLGAINGNPAIFMESKNWLFWLISFQVGLMLFSQLEMENLIKLVSFSILTLFTTYLILNFEIIENPYIKNELAAYHNYKTPGPFLLSPILFQFVFLFNQVKYNNRKYWLYTILSIVIMLISGSLQYLVVLAIGIVLNTLTFNFKKVLVFVSVFIIGFYVSSKYLGEKQLDKIVEVLNPLESGTVQTRISDVTYAYEHNKSNSIYGDGFGVRTMVQRESFFNPNIVSENDFLEVDNGFYYVYHRMGWIGLVSFLIIIFNLQKRMFYKYRIYFILFILINNILSIHFFTSNIFALVFSYFIFNKFYEQKKKVVFN